MPINMSGQAKAAATLKPSRELTTDHVVVADDDDDEDLLSSTEQRKRSSSSATQSIPLSATNCNIDFSDQQLAAPQKDNQQATISYNGTSTLAIGGGKNGLNRALLQKEEATQLGWKSQQQQIGSNNTNNKTDDIYEFQQPSAGLLINSNIDISKSNSNRINLPSTTGDKKLGKIAAGANKGDLIRTGDNSVSVNEQTSNNRPLKQIHYYHHSNNQQQPSVSIDDSDSGSSSSSSSSTSNSNSKPHNQQSDTRLRFKSLLASSSIQESDEFVDVAEQRLRPHLQPSPITSSATTTNARSITNLSARCDRLDTINEDKREHLILDEDNDVEEISLNNHSYVDDDDGDNYNSLSDDELYINNYNRDEIDSGSGGGSASGGQLLRLHNRSSTQRQLRSRRSTSFERLKSSFRWRVVNFLFGSGSKINAGRVGGNGRVGRSPVSSDSDQNLYTSYNEDKDLLTGTSKYRSPSKQRARRIPLGKTFRGSYKYSRTKITMAILKKIANLMIHRSTLALLGAFLIHITLGTVYTLSNINSYMTSYMRKHGSPNATYGGAMWISSSYAVGQGFSMVLGGYIEKRFSARLSCFIGCALHSLSTIATSWSMDRGPLAVLLTYGFIPGFGCGLAYMTPMSNGFGWFPNRKGLVAGVILAGFGIGTFIFNMAQTAYVNPNNLSPAPDADGYFTQDSILIKVPHLFVFIGCIYATMQFIGCCLLFKPPNPYLTSSDIARPILVETEMPLKQSIRRREFYVLFLVYGITTPGILFVNSMLKEYGQLFIGDDMYLAWTGSMGSIANALGRLSWGLAIDKFSFTQCFTSITIIFGTLMLLMPFEFVLSSKLLYLLCTLGIFGSFSGWMSTYPVHLSRVFGRTNSGMIYGLIFMSQSFGGIIAALGAHYLIDHYDRFVPFFCVVFLETLGLIVYHLFYPK